jgi:WD40 repeat protein
MSPSTVALAETLYSIGFGSQEGVIKVWNVVNGEVVQRLHGHRGPITCLGLGPSDEGGDGVVSLCSGSEDGTVRLWRTDPWDEEVGPNGASLVYRKKSLRRPSPRLSKLVALHELFTSRGQEDDSLRSLHYCEPNVDEVGDDEVLSVAWRSTSTAASHDDGQIAAAGRSGRIVVYEARSGERVWETGGHSEPVNCVEYSGCGDELASASDDCTVRLWSADSGEFLGGNVSAWTSGV